MPLTEARTRDSVWFSPLLEDQNRILIQIKNECFFFFLKMSEAIEYLILKTTFAHASKYSRKWGYIVVSLYQSESWQKTEALMKDWLQS